MTLPTMTLPAIGRAVFSFPGRAQPSPFAETPRGAAPRLRFGPSVRQSRGLIRDLFRGLAAWRDIARRLDHAQHRATTANPSSDDMQGPTLAARRN
jgi:hypothetical protein